MKISDKNWYESKEIGMIELCHLRSNISVFISKKVWVLQTVNSNSLHADMFIVYWRMFLISLYIRTNWLRVHYYRFKWNNIRM